MIPVSKQPTLAACRWEDAHGSDGTIFDHEVDHRPYVFTTVGILIRSDEVGVSLASEVGQDGKYRDVTFIPRKMVVEEYIIGPLKPRRPKKQTPPSVDLVP